MNVTDEEPTAEEWCALQINISESRFGTLRFPNLTSDVRFKRCLEFRADGKYIITFSELRSLLCPDEV